jgi:hypothetical protein
MTVPKKEGQKKEYYITSDGYDQVASMKWKRTNLIAYACVITYVIRDNLIAHCLYFTHHTQHKLSRVHLQLHRMETGWPLPIPTPLCKTPLRRRSRVRANLSSMRFFRIHCSYFPPSVLHIHLWCIPFAPHVLDI